MAIEKKFVKKALEDLSVKTFLYKELERAGVSDIIIQKTPIATRISICVRRPGMVVGKKGKAIKELCDALQKEYHIENPQIEVIEVSQPLLDAKLMAERVGKQIEMRPRVKPIMRFALRDIMRAGAIGAEIRAAGKIVGKGGKAKTFTVRAGYIKKSGEPMNQVRKGTCTARLKAGAVGVTVKIVPPEATFSDKIIVEPALTEEEKEVEKAKQKEAEEAKQPEEAKQATKEKAEEEKKEKEEEKEPAEPEKEAETEKTEKGKKKPAKKPAKKKSSKKKEETPVESSEAEPKEDEPSKAEPGEQVEASKTEASEADAGKTGESEAGAEEATKENE